MTTDVLTPEEGVYMRAGHARTQLFYLPFALLALLAGLLCVSARMASPHWPPTARSTTRRCSSGSTSSERSARF